MEGLQMQATDLVAAFHQHKLIGSKAIDVM